MYTLSIELDATVFLRAKRHAITAAFVEMGRTNPAAPGSSRKRYARSSSAVKLLLVFFILIA